MSRSYFGTMIAVEGWAVHMQQLLVTEGFYDEGAERIFFAWSAALMPLAWMRAQILCAKRMLLRGLTYLIGATEIASLRSATSRTLATSAFHRALLDHGPVPPSQLAATLA